MSNCPEYVGSVLRDGCPVDVQLATVLWKFINTSFENRICHDHLGVPAGLLRNCTVRFDNAMNQINENITRSPIDDLEIDYEISELFASLAIRKGQTGWYIWVTKQE